MFCISEALGAADVSVIWLSMLALTQGEAAVCATAVALALAFAVAAARAWAVAVACSWLAVGRGLV